MNEAVIWVLIGGFIAILSYIGLMTVRFVDARMEAIAQRIHALTARFDDRDRDVQGTYGTK